MSTPNKIQWFLGYNRLNLILEQERKHWLLKTDKKKMFQDTKTGSTFQGQIDNMGSDIILETEKLPLQNDIISSITYQNTKVSKVLEIDVSKFPYCSMVNGLMIARVASSSYQSKPGKYQNYKLRLENCEECIIPFGGSLNSPYVFATKWVKTSTVPKLLLADSDSTEFTELEIPFSDDITNVVFYYPLTESLQPFGLNNESTGVYETDMINDEGFIGYPLYWFTCDQTNIGPTLNITNNTNSRGEQLMMVSNEGNSSKYMAKIYTGISGDTNATPDGTSTSNYQIQCSCKEGYTFKDINGDFDIPLDPSSISFVNINDLSTYSLGITCSDKDTITMSKDVQWTYVDENTYVIDMNTFDGNCFKLYQNPLIPIFDVHFDETIPFEKTTTDVGYAGIRMGSANPESDVYDRYPYDLNEWDGLPEWLTNNEEGVPQHLSVYAIHNTPSYVPEVPDSRQVAALLLDPGKMKTDDTDEELSNDERGRVYVLSNDEAVYKNNANETYPKPARTVARMCDIPTSVMQLSGISGIAPTQVVDKKYVRSEASYKVADKNRLYNTLANRWVKPTAIGTNGEPITNNVSQTNSYIFENEELLNTVDLVHYNDFREHINLNPMVNSSKVELSVITDTGSGYNIGDIGVVVVGGFGFHYTVSEIYDDGGGVKNLVVSPISDDYPVNLSNFDMTDGNTGITNEYGTSPLTGEGTGLRFRFVIRDYEELIPTQGEIYPDLFAFVKCADGMYLYTYEIDTSTTTTPKTGNWKNVIRVSEYEQSSTLQSNGGLSSADAYMNSIIPRRWDMPVNLMDDNKDTSTLSVLSTPTFINIIDTSKTPVKQVTTSEEEPTIPSVDLCKFYCDGVSTMTLYNGDAKTDDGKGIVSTLRKANKLRYDSYLIWKWNYPDKPSDKSFTYGFIHRGFNNLQSTDTTTTLPNNNLLCKNFVHSNAGTTVVWNVEDVGMMMWVYNPYYQKHEVYNINPETRDLYITKSELNWNNIDIRNPSSGESITLIDTDSETLLYNIMINNQFQLNDVDNPNSDFVLFDSLKINSSINNIPSTLQPMGNWQLVFPRVNSFRLTNLTNGREFTPVKLQMLKGSDMGNVGNITDSNNHVVNAKTVIVDETSTGLSMKIYNRETGTWVTV